MRFAVIGPVEPYKGGIAHFNTLLVKYLGTEEEVDLISWKRRFPKLLYPGKEQVEKSKEELVKKDLRFFLDMLNPLSWVKAFREIKKKKPSLLIFHWTTPAEALVFWVILALVKAFTKTKTLLICHNVLPHESRRVDRFLTKMVFRKADNFLVHSQEDLINLQKIKKKAEARLGFHPTYAVFGDKRKERDIRKELGLGKKVLLFFGFIREYKGLKYLLEAMPLVRKEVDCELLVVGEFWEDKKEYIKLVDKLGIGEKVKWVSDYVPDEEVGNYFGAADIVVLPYTSATQSGIVQLAFGLGKPVITTRVGGLPEVVGENKTGLLVPPNDAQALAEAIIRFYKENKAEEFGENIRKEKGRFSWERYIQLIKQMAGEGERRNN